MDINIYYIFFIKAIIRLHRLACGSRVKFYNILMESTLDPRSRVKIADSVMYTKQRQMCCMTMAHFHLSTFFFSFFIRMNITKNIACHNNAFHNAAESIHFFSVYANNLPDCAKTESERENQKAPGVLRPNLYQNLNICKVTFIYNLVLFHLPLFFWFVFGYVVTFEFSFKVRNNSILFEAVRFFIM